MLQDAPRCSKYGKDEMRSSFGFMFWLSLVERSDMSALSWIAHLGSCSKLCGVRWSEMKWDEVRWSEWLKVLRSSEVPKALALCENEPADAGAPLSFLDISCGLALSRLSRHGGDWLLYFNGASEPRNQKLSVHPWHPVQDTTRSRKHPEAMEVILEPARDGQLVPASWHFLAFLGLKNLEPKYAIHYLMWHTLSMWDESRRFKHDICIIYTYIYIILHMRQVWWEANHLE
jgi:hypothetical protein